MKTLISVRDKEGRVYSMPSKSPTCILEVHYTTSYYQFIVQDVITGEDGEVSYPEKTIIVPINESGWVDFLAVKESELGELVEELEE